MPSLADMPRAPSETTRATNAPLSDAQLVKIYHQRSKHHFERFAPGPETLDWSLQPEAFRYFDGSPIIDLPLVANELPHSFAQLHEPNAIAPQAVTLHALSALLELAFGLSAWKEYGPDRWALRCNPSSGNLHPTEAYVLAENIPTSDGQTLHGVYHYLSRDHVLQQRSQHEPSKHTRLCIGLTSIHWRELWKYGERGFRYCQLDIGHALGALRYAAATLGWRIKLLTEVDQAQLSQLLGINRDSDYGRAEREDAELLVEVLTHSDNHGDATDELAFNKPQQWFGQANVLDRHHMYRWPIVDEVAKASTKYMLSYEQHHLPLSHVAATSAPVNATDMIKNRRSAQAFDGQTHMALSDFWRLLQALMPNASTPWDVWSFKPRTHVLLFVHRVTDLAPGLYLLLRDSQTLASLRTLLHREFMWEAVGNDSALPLYRLHHSDCRAVARALSCRQAIASDSCFAMAMLSEFQNVIELEPWRYRQLFWEAGLIGQALYLNAEAVGLRGTGIGCYFDDGIHELLDIKDLTWQVLYHFTVGMPITDARIATTTPYPNKTLSRPLLSPTDAEAHS